MTSVCVFCGSSLGTDPAYAEAARAVGRELLRRNARLVYGGGNVGLMGVVADTVLAGGGEVIGVIPHALKAREVAHFGVSKLHVVGSMHERKALMADLSDGFLALPGGFGTFEEFFEVLTWALLGVHAKPCGLLNVNGYYDLLLAFLDRATADGFVRPKYRGLVLAGRSVDDVMGLMDDYRPVPTEKWIGPAES